MKENPKEKIPLNRDPNQIAKLFNKGQEGVLGHDGTTLPYSGGSQTAESGGSRQIDQDPIKDSI